MEELIQKFIDNTISKEELDLLKEWLSEPENNALLQKYIKDDYNLNLALQDVDLDLSLESVLQKINNKEKPVKRIWPNILKYAALALLFVSVTYGVYKLDLFSSAEDIVQQSFVTIWEERKKLKKNISPKSYLYKIAYNNYINQYRTHKKHNSFVDEFKVLALQEYIIEDNERCRNPKY